MASMNCLAPSNPHNTLAAANDEKANLILLSLTTLAPALHLRSRVQDTSSRSRGAVSSPHCFELPQKKTFKKGDLVVVTEEFVSRNKEDKARLEKGTIGIVAACSCSFM